MPVRIWPGAHSKFNNMQEIQIKWSNGRRSKLLIKDNRIKYKNKWYYFKNWRNDHHKTTPSTISFILLNVPCDRNYHLPWNPLHNSNITVNCSCKITFYWDGYSWRYMSSYITGPIDLSYQLSCLKKDTCYV